MTGRAEPKAVAPPTTSILIYDDGCPFCTFQVRALSWLDWFNKASLAPLSGPRAKELAPHLTRADLLAAIHCVTPDGTIHRGARALRYVGLRVPLLFPMSLLMWFPGVIWIAEIVYKFVARNRYVISKMFGCKEACSILPERKRPDKVETKK